MPCRWLRLALAACGSAITGASCRACQAPSGAAARAGTGGAGTKRAARGPGGAGGPAGALAGAGKTEGGPSISLDPGSGTGTCRQQVDDPRQIKPYRDLTKRAIPLAEEEAQ